VGQLMRSTRALRRAARSKTQGSCKRRAVAKRLRERVPLTRHRMLLPNKGFPVQTALERLSGTYMPRQREIVKLEEMLSESLAGLKRLGEDETEQRQRDNELAKKIARFNAISRYFGSGRAFIDYPLGVQLQPPRVMR
jgi:hypothetical protein